MADQFHLIGVTRRSYKSSYEHPMKTHPMKTCPLKTHPMCSLFISSPNAVLTLNASKGHFWGQML